MFAWVPSVPISAGTCGSRPPHCCVPVHVFEVCAILALCDGRCLPLQKEEVLQQLLKQHKEHAALQEEMAGYGKRFQECQVCAWMQPSTVLFGPLLFTGDTTDSTHPACSLVTPLTAPIPPVRLRSDAPLRSGAAGRRRHVKQASHAPPSALLSWQEMMAKSNEVMQSFKEDRKTVRHTPGYCVM